MVIKILWTDNAIIELRVIFDYYVFNAGKKTAKKITNGLFNESIKLKKNPFIGQKEELLSHLPVELRYLISGNYKIVYWIEDSIIYVASVFDCRQNPVKLKNKSVGE